MKVDDELEKKNAEFWKTQARFATLEMLIGIGITFLISTCLMLFITSFSNMYIQYVIFAVYSYFAIRIIHKNYTEVLAGNLTRAIMSRKIRTVIISVITMLTFASIIYGGQNLEIKPDSSFYGY